MRPVHCKMANLLTPIHTESPQDSIAKFYELEQEDAWPAVPRSLGLGSLQKESRLAMANSWAGFFGFMSWRRATNRTIDTRIFSQFLTHL
jgi:hypothetical protein